MARPKRFELLTPRFVVWCCIQLSCLVYASTRAMGKCYGVTDLDGTQTGHEHCAINVSN